MRLTWLTTKLALVTDAAVAVEDLEMFEAVLLPLDQSRQALETASKAVELARSHGGRMIVLSVVQPEHPDMRSHDKISALLEQTRGQVVEAGVPCEIVEREGNPAFVICDVADELDVDVIVMGTRSMSLEVESSSTAARVIQLAPCPVLVVP